MPARSRPSRAGVRAEGQEILGVGKVRPEIKAFLVDYSNRLVK
jgi:hypothetical protein